MRTLAYAIADRELTDRYTAVMRAEIPAVQLSHWLAEAHHTIAAYLRRAGIEPTGPPFARYTNLGGLVVVEAGVPVPVEVDEAGPVVASTLPDGRAAVTTHLGPYQDLDRAYAAIKRWLLIHGRSPEGAHWEVYLTDPSTEPDPTMWRTEVVVPYRIG